MRKALTAVLVALAIAATGAVLYRLAFSSGGAAEPEWTLASLSGEVLLGDGRGGWTQGAVKARLAASDRLRTGPGAEATLVHESSHVTVRHDSELEIAALTREASRFTVAEGMVYIEARGDRISLRTPSGASIDADNAGLGVSVKRDGYVQVQVRRGLADFTAMGRTERVLEGQSSDARAGRPPSRSVAIPEAILHQVRFPDAETFSTRLARVEGRIEPGARLRVQGLDVEVDAEGRFEVDVELEEGLHQLEVEAADSLGRIAVERSQPLLIDVTPPHLVGATIGARPVGPAGGDGRRRP